MRKHSFCIPENKDAVQLISTFVFATYIYRLRSKRLPSLSLSHIFTVLAPVELRFIPIYLVGEIGVNRDESGWKRRKSSINTVSHDVPTVSARFVYGSTTTHAGSTTIHPDGATNAQECSRCGHDSIRCYYSSSR